MRVLFFVLLAGLALPAVVAAQAPCNPAIEECR